MLHIVPLFGLLWEGLPSLKACISRSLLWWFGRVSRHSLRWDSSNLTSQFRVIDSCEIGFFESNRSAWRHSSYVQTSKNDKLLKHRYLFLSKRDLSRSMKRILNNVLINTGSICKHCAVHGHDTLKIKWQPLNDNYILNVKDNITTVFIC